MSLPRRSSKSAGWRRLEDDEDEGSQQENALLLLPDHQDGLSSFDHVSLLPDVHIPQASNAPVRGKHDAKSSRSPVGNTFEMRSRSRKGARGEEEEEDHLTQSTSIGSSLNPAFILVDIPIEQGDTLPSFSIKYHVTISELKRLNNMFHDQDFHGRQKLKVPIHKYGILAERFLTSPHCQVSSLQDSASSSHVLVDLSSDPPTPVLSSTPNSLSDQEDEVTQKRHFRPMLTSQSRAAKLFLQNMDKNLQRLAKEALDKRPRSALTEDDLLNSRHRIEALPPVGDGLGCHAGDCAINIKALLCMILCLTVIMPAAFLIYKLYCQSHPYFCSDNLYVRNDSSPHRH